MPNIFTFCWAAAVESLPESKLSSRRISSKWIRFWGRILKWVFKTTFTNLWIMRILAMIVPTTLATAPLHRYLMRYAKQFQNIFDQNSSEFASSELLEKQIEEKFSNKICSSINIMNISKLEKIIWSCKKKRAWHGLLDEKVQKNQTWQKYEKKYLAKNKWWRAQSEKLNNAWIWPKDHLQYKVSCKTKASEVKPTTRFNSGKLLMFAKILLISFIYDLIKTFCFPNEKTKVYDRNHHSFLCADQQRQHLHLFYFFTSLKVLLPTLHIKIVFSKWLWRIRSIIVSILRMNSGTGWMLL